ncbi:MAG: RNA polymerase factor sigma-54 [Prevotella sp.]|nr:RNA polymerase factor sigma-54 [Prevotella sp.]
MAQTQIQEQRQEQRTQQTISSQQLLQTQLVELPLQQLAERINMEMHDNEALEISTDDDPYALGAGDFNETGESAETPETADSYDAQREREERSDALDAALENIGRDDEDLPVYQGGAPVADDATDNMAMADVPSFYDQLLAQVGELSLSTSERYVMEYLIQSLDDDGLLRLPLSDISEHLAIYDNIEISEQQLEAILAQLQQLDPAGIGARSLKECLLLQIRRMKESRLKQLMTKVVTEYFDEFTHKHWDKIGQALGLNDQQTSALMNELRRLNPKPGASMGEAVGQSMHQITPDFIVDTQDDGTVTFTLNNGDLPRLEVSQSYTDLIRDYQTNKDHMTRQQKEALLYARQKVNAAQNFIEAVQMRRRTLAKTMQAIINIQHRFFEEGDESLLRPMILKDIAEHTGLDLSTVSRVSSSKYAQTRWGIFPLKFFFSDGYVTDSGEELSTRQIKVALRDLIDAEDKQHPLSDDALSEALKQQGFPIARRTVAKYREQMGLPVARLRK